MTITCLVEMEPSSPDESIGEQTTEDEDEDDKKRIALLPVQSPAITQSSPEKMIKESNRNNSIDQCCLPLTTNLDGAVIEAVVGPSTFASSIVWLVKLSGKKSLDLIPGELMNNYFAQNVICYYENRIVYSSHCSMQITVDLRKRNSALHIFETCTL